MKPNLWLPLVVTTFVALSLSGCKEPGERTPPGDAPRLVDGTRGEAGKLEENTGQAVDAKGPQLPSGQDGLLPDGQDSEAFVRKIDETAGRVQSGEVPEYVTKMVAHMRRIISLIRDNMEDCDKAVEEVGTYIQQNKEELDSLRKQGDEAYAKMSPDEQSNLTAQTLAMLGPFAHEIAKVNADFATKCTEQADKLAEQMKTFSPD